MDIHAIYRAVGGPFRRRRIARFKELFPEERCKNIVDLGGGVNIVWKKINYHSRLVLVNVDHFGSEGDSELVTADARNTAFPDYSFDLAYSNSLIEHLGTRESQQQFAKEMQRLSVQIWCQTPNKWFPIEPHYLAPFIHWLPRKWQAYWLVRYFSLRGLVARPDRQEVNSLRGELRLLSKAELRDLFPECEIITERFLGWPKSFIVVKQKLEEGSFAMNSHSTPCNKGTGDSCSPIPRTSSI